MSISPVPAARANGIRQKRDPQSRFWEKLTSLWFLLPILVVFVVLILIPLAQSFVFSLFNINIYSGEWKFVGLQNYEVIFTDDQMLKGISFTLLFAFTTTVLVTVLAIPLAVQLNKKFFGRTVARSLFFFLGVPSQAILGLVWQQIFYNGASGGINNMLSWFGIAPVSWLANSGTAKFAVIFVAIWAAVGWHATLYIAYLQAIPADLYESAEVDGAGPLAQFFHITLPQLVPAIVVSTFLLMTSGLKVFDLPYTLTRGAPAGATKTVTQQIIDNGLGSANLSVGAAMSVVFAVACLVIVVLQMLVANWISRRYA